MFFLATVRCSDLPICMLDIYPCVGRILRSPDHSITLTPLAPPWRTQGSVEAVGFCATHHPWVATGGTDGSLKVWDAVSGTCRHTCVHPAAVTRLEWHPAAPVSGALEVIFQSSRPPGQPATHFLRCPFCRSLFVSLCPLLPAASYAVGAPPPQKTRAHLSGKSERGCSYCDR